MDLCMFWILHHLPKGSKRSKGSKGSEGSTSGKLASVITSPLAIGGDDGSQMPNEIQVERRRCLLFALFNVREEAIFMFGGEDSH